LRSSARGLPVPAAEILTSEYLKSVSQGPGVYLMQNEQDVLYVGKAANLRKRLASYARYPDSNLSKTSIMLSKVCRIDTILTTTEKEALILEASLIKKHKSRYNVILRDDKNYPLVKITIKDEWPRIVVTRKRLQDGSRYFGPYSSISSMRSTLKLLYSMFPLRRCGKVRQRTRACLNYQLKRCHAPCIGKVTHSQYNKMIEQALLILEGRNKELLPYLEKEMLTSAEKLHFEDAAKYRDLIIGFKKSIEQQVAVSSHLHNQDIFGLARKDASVAVAVLFVRLGKICGCQTYFLNDPLGKDNRILTETILQYYSDNRRPAETILLACQPEDISLLREHLSEILGKKISLSIPKRGKNIQLITMANTNALQVFSDREKRKQSWDNLNKTLQKKLNLRIAPNTIECVDISNLGGKQAVGSLVCFQEGEKNKQRYRHYRIRTKDTPDDYAMMRETLTRRYKKKDSQDKLPDLLILDGGKGQLNIAEAVIRDTEFYDRIELLAIAKEKQNEGEKLFRPMRKNPIILKKNDPALLFLMRIRDEAHRFGIQFHTKTRDKQTLLSPLDKIKGIGEKRKKNLLQTLGSYKRILAASPEELALAPGVNRTLAQSIHSQLHHDTDKTE
jgi:excinuclease ABC subunit C